MREACGFRRRRPNLGTEETLEVPSAKAVLQLLSFELRQFFFVAVCSVLMLVKRTCEHFFGT